MQTPPLHALDVKRLTWVQHAPRRPAPTDGQPYEGEDWQLIFEERYYAGPVGPRVCIEIKLRGKAPGQADATDGSQYKLMDAITAVFGPVFAAAEDLQWQLTSSAWNVQCSDHSRSYADWKFNANLGAKARMDTGRNSYIPGGDTSVFLRLAFGRATRALPLELAGLEYTWKLDPNQPSQEGQRVVWLLTKPAGLQGFLAGARRSVLGGGPR